MTSRKEAGYYGLISVGLYFLMGIVALAVGYIIFTSYFISGFGLTADSYLIPLSMLLLETVLVIVTLSVFLHRRGKVHDLAILCVTLALINVILPILWSVLDLSRDLVVSHVVYSLPVTAIIAGFIVFTYFKGR